MKYKKCKTSIIIKKCMCACMHACVSACVRACARARARVCVCVCVCVCVYHSPCNAVQMLANIYRTRWNGVLSLCRKSRHPRSTHSSVCNHRCTGKLTAFHTFGCNYQDAKTNARNYYISLPGDRVPKTIRSVCNF